MADRRNENSRSDINKDSRKSMTYTFKKPDGQDIKSIFEILSLSVDTEKGDKPK